MKASPTEIPGVFVLHPDVFEDNRGRFVKTYHEELFRACGLEFTPREEFFSVSHKNVLRGMHFQRPPAAHAKLVYCPAGRVLDVVLDLRGARLSSAAACSAASHHTSRPAVPPHAAAEDSRAPTGVRCIARELSAANRQMLFIPVGCAHGFLALEDHSAMVYQTSTVHSPAHDAGILWDSFDFDWPVKKPILSDRDQKFPALRDFQTPF